MEMKALLLEFVHELKVEWADVLAIYYYHQKAIEAQQLEISKLAEWNRRSSLRPKPIQRAGQVYDPNYTCVYILEALAKRLPRHITGELAQSEVHDPEAAVLDAADCDPSLRPESVQRAAGIRPKSFPTPEPQGISRGRPGGMRGCDYKNTTQHDMRADAPRESPITSTIPSIWESRSARSFCSHWIVV